MVHPVQSVVIVGGGTAGWITAAVIAARHKGRIPKHLSVTLIESPNMPIIGVGEGTWPTLRSTLKNIGVSETDFFRECDAAFKQGAQFRNWATGLEGDAYYHPLVLPQQFSRLNLVPYWLEGEKNQSFCDAVSPQGRICDLGLGPKLITTPEYEGLTNYAYHLDAGKFAAFMQRHCTQKLGVRHVQADVETVLQNEDGDIRALKTTQAGEIAGDLFIDCSGFYGLLLDKTFRVGFRDCGDVLFCDTALAVQVPYDRTDVPVASHTISTAQSAGWIWDIGLPSRRGVGHVYASRYISDEAAEIELRTYLGQASEDLSVRKIKIRAGHREQFWVRNCVAIGMSAGFVEPLEASAIVLIELSAKMVAEQLPACREVMDIVAKRYNENTHYRWGRIIDFLKLHYAISKRRDTAFWVDNTAVETIPSRLQDLLALWRYQPPWFHDEFDRVDEVFPAASYQYVLYGMGFSSEVSPGRDTNSDSDANRAFRDNARHTEMLTGRLPSHRDLISKIREYGLQLV